MNLLQKLNTACPHVWLLLVICLFSSAHAENSSYTLRPNDLITLEVYGEPELSTEVKILKTGQASFPLIGSVNIGGRTVATAAEVISELYDKDFLVNPKITLTVNEYAMEYISVIGAVMTPGQINLPVSGSLDLAAALATAGGPSKIADVNSIKLIRASGGSSTLSYSAIQGTAGKTAMRSGDRIVVSQSKYVDMKVTVLGEVQKPGPVAFPLNGRLDIVNVIAFAGGMTEYANPKKVTINRRGNVIRLNFLEVSQRGDRPFFILPDDVITVAERFF